MENKEQLTLIYAWDAYCGWCYAFSESLRAFHENHLEIPIKVLSGGLFVGDRKQPIGAFPHIPGANSRISQLTGAEFGAAYQKLLKKRTFVMDSDAAAKGYAALRFFAPERAYPLASSMQRAFYYEGKSLSDPATYREIAQSHHLDPEAVLNRFNDAASTKDAYADFTKVQQMGVQSYPTLLLQSGENFINFGGGVMTTEQLEARLDKLIYELQKQQIVEAAIGMTCNIATGRC